MATNVQSDVINRLKRVEGQIRGIQRLVEEGQDCSLDKVGFMILTHRMQECLEKKSGGDYQSEKAMDEAMKLFMTLA